MNQCLPHTSREAGASHGAGGLDNAVPHSPFARRSLSVCVIFLPLLTTIRGLANQVHLSIMSEAKARNLMAAMRPAGSAGLDVASPPTGLGGHEPLRGGLSVGLALVGVCGAALLAVAASRSPEPLIMTILAALATVGVFFLFALTSRHIRWGQAPVESELLRTVLEAEASGRGPVRSARPASGP